MVVTGECTLALLSSLHTGPRGVALSKTLPLCSTASSFPSHFHAPLLYIFVTHQASPLPPLLSPRLCDVMWEETVVCDFLLLWNYKGEIIYANIGQTLVSINTRRDAHSIGLKSCVGIWITNCRHSFFYYYCYHQSARTPRWKPEILLACNRWWKWWRFMADPLPTSSPHQTQQRSCPSWQSYGW